jgi:protein-L-isoaspartate(D-aspartate) O-methyltransferase
MNETPEQRDKANDGPLDGDGTRVRMIELIMDLRSRGVRDKRVLAAIEKIPRHRFVEESFRTQAYADHALPIECGQTISQPFIVGYMTSQLDVGERDKVLEVGTGSGYQTAVLAHLARRVYTIERYRTLLREAEKRFSELRLTNITAMVGDGMKGWPAQAPFDRIIVTAAASQIPEVLVDQLKDGGIMIIPVGPTGGVQHLVKVTKTDEGVEEKPLLPVRFVPLVPGVAQRS